MDRESTVQRLRTTTEQLEQANRLQEQVGKSVGKTQWSFMCSFILVRKAKATSLPKGAHKESNNI